MKELLEKLKENYRSGNGSTQKILVPSPSLGSLLHIVGHIAIKEMIHHDVFVYQELKRRNTLIEIAKEKRKGDSVDTSIRNLANKSVREGETETPSSASRSKRNKNVRDRIHFKSGGQSIVVSQKNSATPRLTARLI